MSSAALFCYAVLIFVASSTPKPLGSISLPIAGLDKVAHFTAFAIFFALAWWAAGHLLGDRRNRWGATAGILVLTIVYALSDEIHQSYVPGRDADFFDFLADCCGALFALAVLRRRHVSTQRGPRPC